MKRINTIYRTTGSGELVRRRRDVAIDAAEHITSEHDLQRALHVDGLRDGDMLLPMRVPIYHEKSQTWTAPRFLFLVTDAQEGIMVDAKALALKPELWGSPYVDEQFAAVNSCELDRFKQERVMLSNLQAYVLAKVGS